MKITVKMSTNMAPEGSEYKITFQELFESTWDEINHVKALNKEREKRDRAWYHSLKVAMGISLALNAITIVTLIYIIVTR